MNCEEMADNGAAQITQSSKDRKEKWASLRGIMHAAQREVESRKPKMSQRSLSRKKTSGDKVVGGVITTKWGIVEVKSPARANKGKVKLGIKLADNLVIGGISGNTEMTANQNSPKNPGSGTVDDRTVQQKADNNLPEEKP